jgi:hypothetical protein
VTPGNGAWLQIAQGTFPCTAQITMPVNPRGITVAGCGFGDPLTGLGGTIIQANVVGGPGVFPGFLFSLGNTSGAPTTSTMSGCWLLDIAFDSGGNTFASNANGINVMCDFFNNSAGTTKGGTTYENLAMKVVSGYEVDFSHTDDGIIKNVITGTAGSGVYTNSGSGSCKYEDCRFWDGMHVSQQAVMFQDCSFQGTITLFGTPSMQQIAFSGLTSFNPVQSGISPASPVFNNTGGNWYIGMDNATINIINAPSGTNGIFSGGSSNHAYFITGMNITFNNASGVAVFLFDSPASGADLSSLLFTTCVNVVGSNMKTKTHTLTAAGSPYPNSTGATAGTSPAWYPYSNN